jgi:hypothetical protein
LKLIAVIGMSEKGISKSWQSLSNEIANKCRTQYVSIDRLNEWIISSVEKIPSKDFDYYVAVGPNPENEDQIIDITVSLSKKIYDFTVFTNNQIELGIYFMDKCLQYVESVEGNCLACRFFFGDKLYWYISDGLNNSDRLLAFTHKVLNSIQ